MIRLPSLFALLLSTTLSGCGSHNTLVPAPARVGALDVPPATKAQLDALRLEVEHAVAEQDLDALQALFPDSSGLGSWVGRAAPKALEPVRFELDWALPTTAGARGEVQLFTPAMEGGGYGRYKLGQAFIDGRDGRFRVYLEPPVEAGVTVEGVTVSVSLHPESEWLAAEAVLRLVGEAGQHVVPLSFAPHIPGEGGGWLRVRSVTFGGAEVPFQVVPGVLAAQVVLPQGGGELRVAYEGLSPVSDSHYLLPDDLLLRGVDSLWIPLPPQTRTTFGLTVDHPSDFEVWAQGTRVGSEALSGGRTRTEFEHSGALPTLYGSDGYATQVVPWGESTLTVAVWKEHAEHLESLSATAQTAMEGLALLGPYPLQQVQLVESGFRDGRGGYGSVGNVALGWRSVVDGGDVDFVAHELAHGWFGGQVPLAASGRTHGQWNETLAEYVSSWALEAEAAGELRCGWSSRYQGLPDNKDRAIRAVGTVSRRGSDHQAITYAKGALLLTSLEDRIGRERVVVWIESVLEAREGQPSTWTHLTDALAELEPAAAEWLVGALDAVGAPEVVPSGGAVQGDELVLRIDQSGPFALSRIEVGFVDGAGGAVGEPARVELEPGSSTVRLPVREGALGVVLDPDCRTPMRSSRDEPLRFSL